MIFVGPTRLRSCSSENMSAVPAIRCAFAFAASASLTLGQRLTTAPPPASAAAAAVACRHPAPPRAAWPCTALAGVCSGRATSACSACAMEDFRATASKAPWLEADCSSPSRNAFPHLEPPPDGALRPADSASGAASSSACAPPPASLSGLTDERRPSPPSPRSAASAGRSQPSDTGPGCGAQATSDKRPRTGSVPRGGPPHACARSAAGAGRRSVRSPVCQSACPSASRLGLRPMLSDTAPGSAGARAAASSAPLLPADARAGVGCAAAAARRTASAIAVRRS